MVSRITVTALAVVATLVTFWVATLVDVSLQVPAEIGNMDAGTTDMTAFNVLFVTIAAGLLALLIASVLNRLLPGEAKRIWSVVAILVLGLSVFLVYQLDLDTATVIWQLILHLVFGLLLMGGFWLSWPDPEPPAEVS